MLKLDAMQRRFPARHYVMVDDKPVLLAAMKQLLGARLTTVFLRQGHYAQEVGRTTITPPADIIIDRKVTSDYHKDDAMTQYKGLAIYSALPVAVLCAMAPFAHAGESGMRFTHKDWTIACDNTRTCRAAGYQAEGNDRAVSLLLTRDAGPGTPVQAKVMLGQVTDDVPADTLSLEIHGQNLGGLDLDQEDGVAVLTPSQVSAVLVGLTGVSKITFVGGKPGERWELSESGANAVLLKMDEFQGRLDTPAALIRRGTGNEDSVLPALPAPTIRIAPQVADKPGDAQLAESPELMEELIRSLADEECLGVPPDDTADRLHVERLSENKLLVSTRCWTAAYNTGDGFWVINDSAPFEPQLVTISGDQYDQGMIVSFQKGRGMADCVWTSSWAWDGLQFVPSQEATTGLCRSVALGGAWQLPTLVSEVIR